jgi:hypothetical protein
MNDDELHEIRMDMGQSVMAVGDAIDAEVMEALDDLYKSGAYVAQLLKQRGQGETIIAGIVGGAMFRSTLGRDLR